MSAKNGNHLIFTVPGSHTEGPALLPVCSNEVHRVPTDIPDRTGTTGIARPHKGKRRRRSAFHRAGLRLSVGLACRLGRKHPSKPGTCLDRRTHPGTRNQYGKLYLKLSPPIQSRRKFVPMCMNLSPPPSEWPRSKERATSDRLSHHRQPWASFPGPP